MTGSNDNLTEAEFTKRAIKKLRKPPQKGIHVKYSGFKDAFTQYFGKDPEETINRLAEKEEIAIREEPNGIMLYLPNEALSKHKEWTRSACKFIRKGKKSIKHNQNL